MERILNQYEKEYMKMAMLKHEETFREQVYELHRLYQIQKILMKNIAKQRRQEENHQNQNATTSNQDFSNKRARQILDLERPAEDIIAADPSTIEDESELELTLGLSCYRGKTSENSDSSSSDSQGKEDLIGQKWGMIHELPPLKQSFLGAAGQRSSNVEDQTQFRQHQDRLNNNPPWLFQALSLNMT